MGFLSNIFKGATKLVSGLTGGDLLGIGADLIGGKMSSDSVQSANSQNQALQYDLAKNGIRYRVADAKAAGLHPLFAMGAPAFNASPSHIADTGMAQAFSNIGQNLGRSINATRTADERAQALMDLQLEGAQLDNDIKRSQIALNRASINPPMPVPDAVHAARSPAPGITASQGDVRVRNLPLERITPEARNRGKEASYVPDIGFSRTVRGGLAPVPSLDVKQRIEDTFIPDLQWSLRNFHLRAPQEIHPSKFGMKPPRGHAWSWNPLYQEWVPVKRAPALPRRRSVPPAPPVNY